MKNRWNRYQIALYLAVIAWALFLAGYLYASCAAVGFDGKHTGQTEKPAEAQETDLIEVRYLPAEEVPATEYSAIPEEAVNLTVRATAYCPCEKCCGKWADGITYTGTTATQGRTIAVDPDVIALGSTVIIGGHEYIAEDTGGAIKGNRIDVFFADHSDALEWGVQEIEVSVIED